MFVVLWNLTAYSCMAPDGLTVGSINDGSGNFRDVGQIKFSVEKLRESTTLMGE